MKITEKLIFHNWHLMFPCYVRYFLTYDIILEKLITVVEGFYVEIIKKIIYKILFIFLLAYLRPFQDFFLIEHNSCSK